jgi:hypothetical protein
MLTWMVVRWYGVTPLLVTRQELLDLSINPCSDLVSPLALKLLPDSFYETKDDERNLIEQSKAEGCPGILSNSMSESKTCN